MPFKSLVRRAWPLLAGLVFLSLWYVPHVQAQNAPADDRLADLSIQVRPEFDQPNVLVMYNGEVASKDQYPRDVSVLIPKDAELAATAYVGANEDLLNTDPPTQQDAGDGFTRVTFKLPAPKFQVEFYYNPLQGAPDKKMDFVYKAAQAADQVELQILEPLKADKFTTVPASVVQTSNTHNFKYHNFNYASVTAGQVLKIQISYTKTDPNPSMASITPPASAAPAAPAEPASSPLTSAPAILIGAALALIALGGFVWWSRRRQIWADAQVPGSDAHRKNRRPGGAGAKRPVRSAPAAGFCPQCGRALTTDDNFCPRCGAKRRTA